MAERVFRSASVFLSCWMRFSVLSCCVFYGKMAVLLVPYALDVFCGSFSSCSRLWRVCRRYQIYVFILLSYCHSLPGIRFLVQRLYTLRCMSLVRYVVISFLFFREKVSYILREETALILRLFAAQLSTMLAVLYACLWAVGGVWCLLGISGAVICERASEPPHLYDAGCIFVR